MTSINKLNVTSKEYRVDSKVAIVTGAEWGTGKVIALTLAEAGAGLTVVDLATKQIEQIKDERGVVLLRA